MRERILEYPSSHRALSGTVLLPIVGLFPDSALPSFVPI